MISSFRAFLFQTLVAVVFVTGCSQAEQGITPDIQSNISAELGAVEKVTVMSTDGQEVTLDQSVFFSEMENQGKNWEVSAEPLKQEDVRFTLVLYQSKAAPLVVSVGETASQYGDITYRGNSASQFYRWLHRQIGQGLINQPVESVQLSADDLGQTKMLREDEMQAVREVLAKAVPQVEEKQLTRQFPLHPYYRMRIHTGEKPLEVTVLTPTLFSVPFGRETHYFHVEGALFSRLTSWLPPREHKEDPFEKLFKATQLRIEPQNGAVLEDKKYDVTHTTIDQGIAHQIVRTLRLAPQLTETPAQPGAAQYILHFTGNGYERKITFYPAHFQIEHFWFSHDSVDDQIVKMLEYAGSQGEPS